MKDLALLTREDLVDMGLPVGPRNRILSFVERMTMEEITPRAPPLAIPLREVPIPIQNYTENTANYIKNIKPEVENFLEELQALKSRRKYM